MFPQQVQQSVPADSRKPPRRIKTRKKAEPTTAMTVSSLQRAATKRNMLIPRVCSRKRKSRYVKNLHPHVSVPPQTDELQENTPS